MNTIIQLIQETINNAEEQAKQEHLDEKYQVYESLKWKLIGYNIGLLYNEFDIDNLNYTYKDEKERFKGYDKKSIHDARIYLQHKLSLEGIFKSISLAGSNSNDSNIGMGDLVDLNMTDLADIEQKRQSMENVFKVMAQEGHPISMDKVYEEKTEGKVHLIAFHIFVLNKETLDIAIEMLTSLGFNIENRIRFKNSKPRNTRKLELK